MTARNALVLVNGQPAELPAGDTLNGAGATPGGANNSIQYNNGGALAGASITGLVKGQGTSNPPIAATAGTDYLAPSDMVTARRREWFIP